MLIDMQGDLHVAVEINCKSIQLLKTKAIELVAMIEEMLGTCTILMEPQLKSIQFAEDVILGVIVNSEHILELISKLRTAAPSPSDQS
jgi:hypothetical protein